MDPMKYARNIIYVMFLLTDQLCQLLQSRNVDGLHIRVK